jgi:hypothetical protein
VTNDRTAGDFPHSEHAHGPLSERGLTLRSQVGVSACGRARGEVTVPGREGLLKPEYSDWYPTVVPGVWYHADWLTDTVLQQLRSGEPGGSLRIGCRATNTSCFAVCAQPLAGGRGPAELMREGGASRPRSCPKRPFPLPVHSLPGGKSQQ